MTDKRWSSQRAKACETSRLVASELNSSCVCITLDRDAMAASMKLAAGDADFFADHVASREHLFSGVPVFLPAADRDAMLSVVGAIETVTRTQGYRDAVANRAPAISVRGFGPSGAFMGYDFHLAGGEPRLIEINTNAGGAFLNAFAARAQLACCTEVQGVMQGNPVAGFDAAVIDMMLGEWRLQRGAGRPNMMAIVDDAPESQFLYPEFVLARRLFEAYGLPAIIADPSTLEFKDGRLTSGNVAIDMVYNRLVDFDLSSEGHAALRDAYVSGAVVVTPNPYVHAQFADKRNLVSLTDPARLLAWGVQQDIIAALASIPRAVEVTAENAASLWERRRTLFFKPVAGFGGKAVYRGDKLTRSVWSDICAARYIAQDLAPPGERQVRIGESTVTRKVDVRLYTWQGDLLLAAARLYQGQTTNFRTEGGGFAPVYFIGD
jgi:hypothetical protein